MDSEPKLRHEFVAMMFAVAIGEVGAQTAALVQARHSIHFLPAYSHLLLATIVIATSWVGWTRSLSPGAKEDVKSVLDREFLVLLTDVFLVVVYFILVKSVDVKEDKVVDTLRLNASAYPETLWITVIFVTYLAWDVQTKLTDYFQKIKTVSFRDWFRKQGVRMGPTFFCLCFAAGLLISVRFYTTDAPHVLSADLALVCLVLLFRTLKLAVDPPGQRKWPVIWSLLFFVVLVLSTIWTVQARALPLPKFVIEQIETTPTE